MTLVCEGLRKIKMMLPTIITVGMAPQFYLVWITWKGLSALLPAHIYQQGDDYLFGLYQKLILFFYENFTITEVLYHGDAAEILRKKENVIFLSNHQSSMDWVIVDMLAERQDSIGHIRYVLKDSLRILPLYGFYFDQHGCIFVKRGNFNEDLMKAKLEYLQSTKIPSWMVIFPEGTRYKPDDSKLLEKSSAFAIREGIKPYKHVLTPRVKGLNIALQVLQSNLDAIYDITVIYSGTRLGKGLRKRAPSMFGVLGGVCERIHIHVDRIPIEKVPREETRLKHWLYERYSIKDTMLSKYYESEEESVLDLGFTYPISMWRTLGPFLAFASISIPLGMTEIGHSIYFKTWVVGSLVSYAWLIVKNVA